MIVAREQVQAAYRRCMATIPASRQDDAVRAVARAFGLAEESVRDAIAAPLDPAAGTAGLVAGRALS